MKIFGNFVITYVSDNIREQIINFFKPHEMLDGVILTIDELEYRRLSFEECREMNCCSINGIPRVKTNIGHIKLKAGKKPYVSYYGNLYKDRKFSNSEIDNDINFDETRIKELDRWFKEEYFKTNMKTYEDFHKCCGTLSSARLMEIKAIFPFFLALNRRDKEKWKCDDTKCFHNIKFKKQPFRIEYCSEKPIKSHKERLKCKKPTTTTFVIHQGLILLLFSSNNFDNKMKQEEYRKMFLFRFDPLNVAAYIGCNKPYVLQINDNTNIIHDSGGKNALEIHNPDKLFATKNKDRDVRNTSNAFKFHNLYDSPFLVWNVLYTIVIDIITSNEWKSSGIKADTDKYDYGEIGSLIAFTFKKLEEHNPNELIDTYLTNRTEHIKYISKVFELVKKCNIEFAEKDAKHLGFKNSFHAADHLYRHYDGIRKVITEENLKTPLYDDPLKEYPKDFPDNLTNISDIKKCLVLYLHVVPFQYRDKTLSKKIIEIHVRSDIDGGGSHITTIHKKLSN